MLLTKHRFALFLSLFVALATLGAPLAAHAQRKSPLADAPAIRKRFELRQTRLELGVGAGSTINQDFYHTVLVNVRLGFHITDWLSLAGFGDFGVAQISTGFENKLVNSLDQMPMTNVLREPSQDAAKAGLQQISNILGAPSRFQDQVLGAIPRPSGDVRCLSTRFLRPVGDSIQSGPGRVADLAHRASEGCSD